MARTEEGNPQAGPVAGAVGRVAALAGARLDAAVTALVLLSVVGFLLDVRSHMAGLDFEEEGFATPEHTVIYGGVVLAALLVVAVTLARRYEAPGWRAAVPDGYGPGFLGLGLFALGGPGDLLWHSLFGAEANVEALVSPTHLLLATGVALFATSPLRANWRRRDAVGPLAQFAVAGTAALVLTIFTGFTLYTHPAFLVPGAEATRHALPLAGLQLNAALLAGTVLLLVDRFRLRRGWLTVLVGFNGAAMTLIGESFHLLGAYLLAGAVADLLVGAFRPSADRPGAMRVLGAAVPGALAAAHFGTLALRGDLVWSVHLWAGGVFLAAAAGLLVSYLVVPLRGP
jgi:hypothetical protein